MNDAPEFDVSPSPGRAPMGGWIFVGAVLLFLIGVQMASYLGRAPRGGPDVAALDGRIRMAYRIRDAMAPLAQGQDRADTVDRKWRDELESVLDEVGPSIADDGAAALLHTIVSYELGREPDADALRKLRAEEGPRRRAGAKAYRSERLSAEVAEELARPFDGSFFVDRIARAHIQEKAGVPDARDALRNPRAGAMLLGATLLLVGAAGLGGILLVVFLAHKAGGRIEPKGHPAGRVDAVAADGLAFRTGLMLTGLFGSQMLLAYPLRATGMEDAKWTMPALFGIGLLLALWILRLPHHGRTFSPAAAGLHRREFGRNCLWGIGAALANIPILIVAALIGTWAFQWLPAPQHPVQLELSSDPSFWSVAAILLSAAVGAPLFEEICFRGTFLPALMQRLRSPAWGMAACGFLFASIHPTGVPAWLALMSIGTMASYVTYLRGSLVPAIVMHAVHNASIVLISTSLLA